MEKTFREGGADAKRSDCEGCSPCQAVRIGKNRGILLISRAEPRLSRWESSPAQHEASEGRKAMCARQRQWGVLVGAVLVCLGGAPGAWAQGFIVDRRPSFPVARSYEIREVSIDARVRDQVA